MCSILFIKRPSSIKVVCSRSKTEGANCIVDDDGCSPLTPWEQLETNVYLRSSLVPVPVAASPDNNCCCSAAECPINNLLYSLDVVMHHHQKKAIAIYQKLVADYVFFFYQKVTLKTYFWTIYKKTHLCALKSRLFPKVDDVWSESK